MSRDPLRYYPRAWRDRYGEEMRALIEDDLDGRAPTRRYLARLAVSGIRERVRASGLAGDSTARARRWAGSSTVLYAWVALCAAGGSFAKSAEHFRSALPVDERLAPSLAYDVVVAGALAGGIMIAAGVAVALPGFAAAARRGAAPAIGRAVVRAAAATVSLAAGTLGLAAWAHHLDAAQRNGANGAYSAAFVAWALAGVVTLALWAKVSTRAARATLSDRALRVESRLAVGVTAAAVVVSVASGWWWAEMASRAPAFLTGSAGASILDARAVGTLGLMALAIVAAGYGVARIASARA